ncbi:MAG: TMEM165/GDT1 family protein [Thermoplasmata archaeon]
MPIGTDTLVAGLTVFVVIAGLELGDRTNFSLVALAARGAHGEVFAGAAVAFLASTAVAVTLGTALVAAIGPSRIGLLRIAGGAILLGYSGWLAVHPPEPSAPLPPSRFRSAFAAALVTTFLLELGDTTMIFQILFVSSYGPVIVLVAGGLGLIATAAVGTTVGRLIGRRVDPRLLHWTVVVLLAVVGILSILYGLVPGLLPGTG